MANKKTIYLIKESGEKEALDIEKLQNSLKKSGVPTELRRDLLQKYNKSLLSNQQKKFMTLFTLFYINTIEEQPAVIT